MEYIRTKGRLLFTALIILFCLIPAGSVFAGNEEEMEEPYRKREFVTMQEAGELGIPESVTVGTAFKDADRKLVIEPGDEAYLPADPVDPEEDDAVDSREDPDGEGEVDVFENEPCGIYLSASEDVMTDMYVTLKKSFTFTEKSVDRITLDAQLIRGEGVSAAIYLDDAKSPFVTFQLRKRETFHTVDLTSMGLQGEHTVAIAFKGKGEGEDKQIKVLLGSLGFEYYSVPVIYFNIDESKGTVEAMNQSKDHSVGCTGSIDILVPEGYRSEFSTEEQADIKGLKIERVRGRGNSTWEKDKKPYSLKLEKKASLLGMGNNKNWVLLADYYDNSHLRNRTTYWFCRSLDQLYAIRCVPVEVVMNGDYYGTYLLSENVRVGEGRVEIAELTETDEELPAISGGYLMAMSPYGTADERSVFQTEKGIEFEFETPDFVTYENQAQKDYISGYLQKTEDAIFGENFRDADGVSYMEYMDLDAAVDYWWMQEFTMNGDAFVTDSTRLYKDRNGKLIWGPAWDFDYVAWGNLQYDEAEAMQYKGFNNTVMSWFDRLKADPVFIQALKDRWTTFDGKLEQITKEGGILDRYYKEQVASKYYDYERWGYYSSPNSDYRSEVEQFRKWIEKRRAWVNEHLNDLDSLYTTVTFLADGQEYTKESYLFGEPRQITLPNPPEKEGYYFTGWFLENGRQLSSGTVPDGDFAVNAKYIPLDQLTRAEEIFLQAKEIWIPMDESEFYMSYSTYPADAELCILEWESSDPAVATMKEDTLVKVGVGDTTVTATLTGTRGEKTETCLVHIYDPKTENVGKITSFRPVEDSLEVNVGQYRQIQLVFQPEVCSANWGISYESKDESVAFVDNLGVVTGVSAGSTTIRIQHFETGIEEKVQVTVSEAVNYSGEWVKGRWYNKDGTQTYKGIGSWSRDSRGWKFGDTLGWSAKNCWQAIDGKWYYFDPEGYMEKNAYRKGLYLTGSGAWDGKEAAAVWKKDGKGWWYRLPEGTCLKNTWIKIDGKWYYFKADGYLAQSEFIRGWWIGKNGVQSDPVRCGWHKTARGWWYGVSGGWYAKSRTCRIDGTLYAFDQNGYLIEE